MDSKEAVQILINMLKKYPFKINEREAIKTAIGILGWTKLAENRIGKRKKRGGDFD